LQIAITGEQAPQRRSPGSAFLERLHGHRNLEDPIQVVRLVAPSAIAGEVFLARMNAL